MLTAEMTMSLDGFITDPDASVGTSLEGHDPGRLHAWMFDAKTDADAAIREDMYAPTGAVLMGKTMFDVGFEPWGDPPPFKMPVFIVTHEERAPLRMKGGTIYNFVTGGIVATLLKPKPQPVPRTSASGAARTSSGSTWRPGCWTRCTFTSLPHCSAVGSGSSRVSIRKGSNCGRQVASIHPVPRMFGSTL